MLVMLEFKIKIFHGLAGVSLYVIHETSIKCEVLWDFSGEENQLFQQNYSVTGLLQFCYKNIMSKMITAKYVKTRHKQNKNMSDLKAPNTGN